MTAGKRWKIEITAKAEKQMGRLDSVVVRRIREFVHGRLAVDVNPIRLGVKMAGEEDMWRFRVGGYRIITRIQAERMIILVVEVGSRGGIYKHRG